MRYRSLVTPILLLTLSSCAQAISPIDDRQEPIKAVETSATAEALERRERIRAVETSATAEALKRKERSEARLRSEGVPVNPSLPVIEDVGSLKRRVKEEIAWRAMALLVVAGKGEGLDQPTVDKVVADYDLDEHLTPKEATFINQVSPSEHDRIQFSWRYEAAWTLLWALGYVDELEKPTGTCDVPRAVNFFLERTAAQFIADSKLRPIEHIADEADLIYRYHWAVVDARINGRPSPAALEPGVTMERHHALNWLIGYMDQEWDDVSTDT